MIDALLVAAALAMSFVIRALATLRSFGSRSLRRIGKDKVDFRAGLDAKDCDIVGVAQ
jgi:hypothetical protein